MEKVINQRIANTNIFVFGYNPQTQHFTYSRPFTKEEAESLAHETNNIIASQYKGSNGLREGLQARDGGLINMSTLKGIAANRMLMRKSNGQQWLPTINEGVLLQYEGMLPSGVLIDFGIALYDVGNPDKEIAQALTETARQIGYTLPVLASFKSLDLVEGGQRYGVTPKIVSADRLIHGDEARKFLDNNKFYKENSGVRRLHRDRGGFWGDYWGDSLDGFYEYCRVERFSAVGSAQKLEEETLDTFIPIRKSLDSVLSLAQN